ncbi:MAG TPA: hypothetical protein VFM37_15000 [Pseudonocardiaceae bacterium]|nr:hypothetical protein [Pseudonocardiaceae bacterium]
MGEQRYEICPLGAWLGPETAERVPARRFSAPWPSTLDLLGRETYLLGATLVVLQLDVRDGDVRRDGMLRVGARVGHPGVRVSFDSGHGPLTYSSDAYDGWQANVRAVALALQALRAVDRYGVSRSGEQYRGWRAIEGPAGQMSVDTAARLLADAGDVTPAQVLADADTRARAYRRAARTHHPDAGGDPATFLRLTAAKELLDGAAHLIGAPQ